MIGIIAHLYVQPDKAVDFEAQFAANAAIVDANEPGCFLYQLTKDAKTKGFYTVLELYKDEASVKAHMTNLSARANKGQPNYMTAKPSLIIIPILGEPVFRKDDIASGASGIAIVAKLRAKPGSTEQMVEAFGPAGKGVHEKEPGTHLYAFGEDPKEHGSFYYMEMYKDMRSVGAHGKMPHFKVMGRAQAPLMTAKPEISFRQLVGKSHAKL